MWTKKICLNHRQVNIISQNPDPFIYSFSLLLLDLVVAIDKISKKVFEEVCK
jgi:hypothetical protein